MSPRYTLGMETPAGTPTPGATHAIVIRTAGINCDREMVRGFAAAGAEVSLVHLDAVCAHPTMLDAFDLIGFPGGFSYGDDVASGRIYAMKVRRSLLPALQAALDRGCPMLGICNGFQVLVQCGLLPGFDDGHNVGVQRSVGLTDNACGHFVDSWVRVEYQKHSHCIWTRGLDALEDDALLLPVAHGEGRFVARDQKTLEAIEAANLGVIRYTDNYNGSDGRIAGLCDPSGLVLGLMPHPDRFLEWTRHPFWTRLPRSITSGPTPGLVFFQNAVQTARANTSQTMPVAERVGYLRS